MKQILFVSERNDGRCQMAQALFNLLAWQRGLEVRAVSAGLAPAAELDPEVVRVMAECGVSLARQSPQPLTAALVREAVRVVSLEESVTPGRLPVPAVRFEMWPLPGEAFPSRLRDAVREQVERLVEEIAPAETSPWFPREIRLG